MYYYVYNLQGDVTHIMKGDKTIAGTYQYDAWGKILNLNSLTAIAKVNPFRYRGYYYDTESNLYYLNSRYYNPEWGRFINADGLVSTGQDILGFNMFAYCRNNPVNMVDPSGEIAITTLILIGSIVAGAAVSGYTAYTSYKYTGKVDWGNTILSGVSTFAFCYTCGMSAYGIYLSYCDYKGYTPVANVGPVKATPAPDNKPFLPDSFYSKHAPKQSTPNSSYTNYTYNSYTGKYEKSTAYYDFAGRQSIRIDWTNHGYSNHGNPHVHYTIYDSQYRDGITIRWD